MAATVAPSLPSPFLSTATRHKAPPSTLRLVSCHSSSSSSYPSKLLSLSMPRTTRRHHPRLPTLAATQDTGGGGSSSTAETPAEDTEQITADKVQEEKEEEEVSSSAAATAEAIKEKLAEARASGGGWWEGVSEEIVKIEWPMLGKVLGTTGVVISVIAGSSVALLTVNAILAEISDRVFAGKGVQDFF